MLPAKPGAKSESQIFTDAILTQLASDANRSLPLHAQEEPLSLQTQLVDPDEAFNQNATLMKIDTNLSDADYVKAQIDRARGYFNLECGNREAKKENLGDC